MSVAALEILNWGRGRRGTHRELAGVEEIVVGVRSGGNQDGGELADRHHHHAREDEGAEPVADDLELLPQAEVLLQHRQHLRLLLEYCHKFLQPQDVEVANGPEDRASEKEARRPVYPRRQLQRARHAPCRHRVLPKGDPIGAERVPPDLVGHLRGEAGRQEHSEEAKRPAELGGIRRAYARALCGYLV